MHRCANSGPEPQQGTAQGRQATCGQSLLGSSCSPVPLFCLLREGDHGKQARPRAPERLASEVGRGCRPGAGSVGGRALGPSALAYLPRQEADRAMHSWGCLSAPVPESLDDHSRGLPSYFEASTKASVPGVFSRSAPHGQCLPRTATAVSQCVALLQLSKTDSANNAPHTAAK